MVPSRITYSKSASSDNTVKSARRRPVLPIFGTAGRQNSICQRTREDRARGRPPAQPTAQLPETADCPRPTAPDLRLFREEEERAAPIAHHARPSDPRPPPYSGALKQAKAPHRR